MSDLADELRSWANGDGRNGPRMVRAAELLERYEAALHHIAYGTDLMPAPDLDQCINIARNTLNDGTVPAPIASQQQARENPK